MERSIAKLQEGGAEVDFDQLFPSCDGEDVKDLLTMMEIANVIVPAPPHIGTLGAFMTGYEIGREAGLRG